MQEGLGGAAQSAGTTFAGALANVKAALSRLGETAATPVLNGLRACSTRPYRSSTRSPPP